MSAVKLTTEQREELNKLLARNQLGVFLPYIEMAIAGELSPVDIIRLINCAHQLGWARCQQVNNKRQLKELLELTNGGKK